MTAAEAIKELEEMREGYEDCIPVNPCSDIMDLIERQAARISALEEAVSNYESALAASRGSASWSRCSVAHILTARAAAEKGKM